jgi:hypothetical protein
MTTLVDIVPGIAPQWPALARSGPLLASPGWLRAMTGRLGDAMATILVSQDGEARLAALATVQHTPRPGEFFDLHHVLVSTAPALPLTERSRAARAELAVAGPGPDRWAPNLVVMLPGYECVPVGPGREDPRLLGALIDGAQRWAEREGLRAVAFLYTRPDAAALGGALESRGFTAVPLSLTWDLPVPADGLTGYLAALPHKRRREAQREMRRLNDAGVAIELLDARAAETEPMLATLTALRCQLVRKYRGKADEQVERRRLDSLVRDVCAGNAQLVTARAGDAVLGFALFAPYGDAWHCLAVGYDYTDPRFRLAYFATMFYGAIPAAVAAGVGSLGFGQGSAQAKRSRGCFGTPLTGWVRSGDADLTAAVIESARITELLSATDQPALAPG